MIGLHRIRNEEIMMNIRYARAFALFMFPCAVAFGDPMALLLDGTWKLRHDPDNVGKDQQWWGLTEDKE